MTTTTRTKPDAATAVAWPAHATTTSSNAKAWHAADAYEAARAAGCTLPTDLTARVAALATAADWRLDLEDLAANLSNAWDDAAMAAAKAGKPMPDLAPLIEREQLLAVRGEVASRIGAIITTATTAVVAYMRDNADTIVADHLRPRFDTLVDDAAPLADAIPVTATDDAAALRAGCGAEWLALESHAATYRYLTDARNALADVTGWPAADPRRVHLIGSRTTMHALDREPQHPVARFAHRIRNRADIGLWMPSSADVAALTEASR